MKTVTLKISEDLLSVAITTVEQQIRKRKNRISQIDEIINQNCVCRVGGIQIESDQLSKDIREQLTQEREIKAARVQVLEELLAEFKKHEF